MIQCRHTLPGLRLLGLWCFVGIAVPAVLAADNAAAAAKPVSFYHDLQPIFREHCQGCHQPARAKGDFVTTTHAFVMGKGRDEDADPTVVPGRPSQGVLIAAITPENGKASMPKGKDPLTPEMIALIVRWVEAGAIDDTPATERVQYTMENPPVYPVPPVVTSVDFSPDGKLLAVSGNNEVLLHRSDGAGIVARLVGLSERIESVVFSPDGKLLAVTGGSPARLGEVQIWDVEKQRLRLSYPVTFDTIYGASWSTDGNRVAFGCTDNTLRVIEVKTGKQVLYQGAHSDWVLGTTFSVDSSHLVSVSRDRSMKLILVATEQFVDNITSITPGALRGGLMCVDRHPNKDEILVGGADGKPKIYRMHREKARKIGDDYNLIRTFDAMPGRVFSVEFSAEGERIVAASGLDTIGEVRVYSTADGKLVSSYRRENGSIYTASFSGDGLRVAAAGFDGKVRLIEAATGKLVKEFLSVPIAPREKTF